MTDVQTVSETASAAAGSATDQAPADAGPALHCPECSYVGKTETGLKIHWRLKHKGIPEPQWTERPARKLEAAAASPAADEPSPGAPPARTTAELEAVRTKTVESLQTLAGWVFVVGLQVTGVTLDHRAERLSFQAIAYAERSERFLRALEAFNSVMAAGDLAKIGSDLGMAFGVDIGVLHPAKPVRFGPVNAPGFLFLRPIAGEMAEVAQLREVAASMEQQWQREVAQARSAENGMRPQDAASGQ